MASCLSTFQFAWLICCISVDTYYCGGNGFAWIKKFETNWIDSRPCPARIITLEGMKKISRWPVVIYILTASAFTRFSIDYFLTDWRRFLAASLLHGIHATLSECKRSKKRGESVACFWDVAVQWDVNFEIEKGSETQWRCKVLYIFFFLFLFLKE